MRSTSETGSLTMTAVIQILTAKQRFKGKRSAMKKISDSAKKKRSADRKKRFRGRKKRLANAKQRRSPGLSTIDVGSGFSAIEENY